MTRIRVLPEEIANRIAAGEVVERPASVIKELLDNAIDADARSVMIDLEGGGIERIRIADDGEGMGREDALLAFERHATSKLSGIADLFAVETLGFRGEALPSIAAVSKIRLVTAARGEIGGTELILEGGKVLQTREAGVPAGSTFEVSDLFYNTPARRKFLRSKATELSHTAEVVAQAALAHARVHFRLSHEGRMLADYPAVGGMKERLLQVLGEKRASSLVEGEFSTGKLKVLAYLSRPTVTQGSRKDQLLFVNRRPVRQPLLVHAVYEAYETLLRKGEHPFFVLYITIDPSLVDVNVHPAKREVRFSEQGQIYPLLKSRLREILLDRGETPSILVETGPPMPSVFAGKVSSFPISRPAEPQPGETVFREAEPDYDGTATSLPADAVLRPIGQVYDTFLLIEVDGDLAVVDQHTAHERVLYERLLEQIENARLEVQPLLIPAEVRLSPSQRLLLLEFLPTLTALGLEVEPSSEATFWVRTVPALSVGTDPERMLLTLLDEIEETGKGVSLAERTRLLAATLACHAAVRAGRPLRLPEIEALLADLMKSKAPFTCPHGRPVLIRYPREELERQFHRR
ncbi:MAG TPA: DNA mismatch repair endonuclease MutL [Nitrospiria bacterium]|nr:DNA mismatch repair endonuclease MutL [Nitrospiria bacterium]